MSEELIQGQSVRLAAWSEAYVLHNELKFSTSASVRRLQWLYAERIVLSRSSEALVLLETIPADHFLEISSSPFSRPIIFTPKPGQQHKPLRLVQRAFQH